MSMGKIAIDERTDLLSYRRKTKDKSKNKDYSKKAKEERENLCGKREQYRAGGVSGALRGGV